MEKAGQTVVVGVVVMVVNAFNVVACSSRDWHNTVRELSTGVQRASRLSRASSFTVHPTSLDSSYTLR